MDSKMINATGPRVESAQTPSTTPCVFLWLKDLFAVIYMGAVLTSMLLQMVTVEPVSGVKLLTTTVDGTDEGFLMIVKLFFMLFPIVLSTENG